MQYNIENKIDENIYEQKILNFTHYQLKKSLH